MSSRPVTGKELGALLAAAESIDYVAEDEVNGVATTHLRASLTRISLDELARHYPDSIVDLDIDVEGEPVPFDIWLDVKGLPRRLMIDVDQPDMDSDRVALIIELFEFGEELHRGSDRRDRPSAFRLPTLPPTPGGQQTGA